MIRSEVVGFESAAGPYELSQGGGEITVQAGGNRSRARFEDRAAGGLRRPGIRERRRKEKRKKDKRKHQGFGFPIRPAPTLPAPAVFLPASSLFVLPSSLFVLPSSHFVLPSFLLPSSHFVLPSFLLPSSLFPFSFFPLPSSPFVPRHSSDPGHCIRPACADAKGSESICSPAIMGA